MSIQEVVAPRAIGTGLSESYFWFWLEEGGVKGGWAYCHRGYETGFIRQWQDSALGVSASLVVINKLHLFQWLATL